MTRMDLDSLAVDLASKQEGALSRAQLLGLGFTGDHLHHRLRSGHLVRAAPGVYTVAGAVRTWRQRLWVASLDAGPAASVSHRSAAAVHQVTGFGPGPVEIIVSRPGRHRPKDGVAYHLTVLSDRHVCTVDGLRLTTVPRTLCDLAAVLDRKALERALDNAVAARSTTYPLVAKVAQQLLRPGKAGMIQLAGLLDERAPGQNPPATELERLLAELVKLAGIEPMVVGAAFPGRREIGHCVDGAIPTAMLVLEADGRRWHQRVEDLRRDRLRDNEAARHGWLTMRFMYEDLVKPSEQVGTLRDVYVGRLRLLHAARSA